MSLALLVLVACEKVPPGCAESDAPTVTIGVGENAYQAHSDGGTAELIHGPQGGVHITLAVETTGFATSEDLLSSFEGTIGGEAIAASTPFVFLRCNNQTGTQQAWDLRLIYDDQPEALDGQQTEVSVTLTDADGREASSETTFMIDDPTL